MFGVVIGAVLSLAEPGSGHSGAAEGEAAMHVQMLRPSARAAEVASVLGAVRGDSPSAGGGPWPSAPGACAVGDVRFTASGIPEEGDVASAVRFSPDGSKIYVAHRESRNIVVFDAVTRVVLGTIPLSGGPIDMDISPDGARAITANTFENSASIVDLASGSETAVIPVGEQPGVARFMPGGAQAVVGNSVDSDISVIDVASATETSRIAGTEFILTLSFNTESGQWTLAYGAFLPISSTVLVHADYFNAEVDVVDLSAGTVTSIPTAVNPRGMALTGTGSVVVTHAYAPRTISIIDPTSASIIKTIAAPEDLWGPVAVNPAGTVAIVSVQNACRRVDLVTDTFSAAVNTASVYDLVRTSDGLYALGVGFNGSLISFSTGAIVKNLNTLVSTALGAVSPTAPRAVLVANVFGEDLLVVNTNGAAGLLEGRTSSGPPPELDRARHAAISADGSRVVTLGIFSDTAQVVDGSTGATIGVVAVGDRPSEVAITPDGSKAVVANLDSTSATVIDLSTLATTIVPISTRASQVEISPDGAFAYVAVVASGDGVWRINLLTNTVQGSKISTGDMGSVGYLYWQSSGMTLSHDGSLLVTCGSFSNTITFIDTGFWSLVATTPVAGLPTRATFSADDSVLYVASRDADSIAVVDVATRTVIDSFVTGDQPYEMVVSADGSSLYVIDGGLHSVRRIDTATGATLAMQSWTDLVSGIRLIDGDGILAVATGQASVTVGAGGSSIDRHGSLELLDALTLTPCGSADVGYLAGMMSVSADGTRIVLPQPSADGVTVVDVAASLPCPEDVNGDGAIAFGDVLAILNAWGPCFGSCAEDVNEDGLIGFADVLAVLTAWGPCP